MEPALNAAWSRGVSSARTVTGTIPEMDVPTPVAPGEFDFTGAWGADGNPTGIVPAL